MPRQGPNLIYLAMPIGAIGVTEVAPLQSAVGDSAFASSSSSAGPTTSGVGSKVPSLHGRAYRAILGCTWTAYAIPATPDSAQLAPSGPADGV